MPSVLTGAYLANRELIYLGVSGDGDSASIGLGQFAHVMRRGVNMTYLVENNGVYGLTKGQFSATADKGSKSKKGQTNNDAPIDLVTLALVMGATFVARGFSGDKTQLVPLIRAALAHQGAAVIDILSPCIAFNNHTGSTKSYDYVREHNEAVNRLDFFPQREEITADYGAGEVIEVRQHDGSVVRLRKLHADYDPGDRIRAMSYVQEHAARGEVVTGLLYVDTDACDLHQQLCPGSAARITVEHAAEHARRRRTVPRIGAAALEKINASLRYLLQFLASRLGTPSNLLTRKALRCKYRENSFMQRSSSPFESRRKIGERRLFPCGDGRKPGFYASMAFPLG
jgi:2-oxoglutarate ferredoxin oxidoreductase subunit beta